MTLCALLQGVARYLLTIYPFVCFTDSLVEGNLYAVRPFLFFV